MKKKHLLKKTTYFTSYQTVQTFNMFHQLKCNFYQFNYKPQYQIYHLQYGDKSEAAFNLRLNNHRKDSKAKKKKKKEAILACKHFQTSHHIFQRDANFTPVTAEQLRLIPKKQGKF